MDFSMSSRASIGLPSVRRRGPSGLNLLHVCFRLKGHTKVLSKNVHCRSLSSIHILYNQALVGGLSAIFHPATRIALVQLPGGSK
jgi:hypothetical protein